jgi:DNA-binding NarL/FixJ family response regulator
MIMANTILLVENSDIVVIKLRKLLESIENLDIIGDAADSYAAIAMISEHKPDYVILDLSLNLGHGIKVLEEIALMKETPYVIVLTNLNYQYYKDKCLKLGARHFFDKAMEFEKVYEILNSRTNLPA